MLMIDMLMFVWPNFPFLLHLFVVTRGRDITAIFKEMRCHDCHLRILLLNWTVMVVMMMMMVLIFLNRNGGGDGGDGGDDDDDGLDLLE